MNDSIVLKTQGLNKCFSGVQALSNFSFECRAGEVHVLMGENGAGKSTLLKILGGIYRADAGKVFLDGEEVLIGSPIDAKQKGIAFIHQELSMCKNMTVAENIFRGSEPTKKPFGFVDDALMLTQAQVILDALDMCLRADDLVSTLSIAQQQMVEIAGALSQKAKVVVMDEPTASLTEREISALFDTVATLKSQGVCIIYVSHRMNETFEIGDRVTVMRDGVYVGTREIDKTNQQELIEMMVGRPLTDIYSGKVPLGGKVVLEVRNFCNDKLKNVDLELRKGEILGLAGLVGAGRTELARAIFGLDKVTGTLLLDGMPIKITSPRDAIRAGIGFVPEDRKGAGLILGNTVGFNLTITVVDEFIKGIRVDKKKEQQIIDKYSQALSIHYAGPGQLCQYLSGGNQQKIVISKWLATGAKYLIFDEPTRGIDVRAKSEIYHLINDLANEGMSVIFISSDLVELINVSSRVAVMHEGRITAVLDARDHELTQVEIMKFATGGMT